MNLGFVGAGSMAFEHARVFEALNCKIIAVAATKESKTIESFARRFSVPNQFRNWREMLNISELDALIVASPPEISSQVGHLANENNIPALIEKPGAASTSNLLNLGVSHFRHIYFGYNRRFYESIEELKCLSENRLGFFTFDLVEPTFDSKPARDSHLINVSVHMFDLIRYLIPGATLESLFCNRRTQNYIYAIHQGEGDASGILHLSFGSIRNQSINWDSQHSTATVKPIEVLNIVNRFSVREPTLAEPIRRYIPVYDQTNEPLKILSNSTFKPGFYSQGVEFLGVLNGHSSANVRLATLDDAWQSLKIAEQICREI
jgi:predicted dehydrogenase